MQRSLLAISVLGLVRGAVHDVCHSNDAHMTSQEVVAELAACVDRDNNSFVKEAEVLICFSELLGTPLPVPSGLLLTVDYSTLRNMARLFKFTVPRDPFVTGWSARFHDSPVFTTAIFTAYDSDNDGQWSVEELDRFLRLIKTTSDDGDGVITKQEFSAFMLQEVYSAPCEVTELTASR